MRIIRLIVLLSITINKAVSQDNNLVDSFNSRAFEYIYSNPDSVEFILDDALRLATHNKYERGINKAYLIYGVYFSILNQYDSAQNIYPQGTKKQYTKQ